MVPPSARKGGWQEARDRPVHQRLSEERPRVASSRQQWRGGRLRAGRRRRHRLAPSPQEEVPVSSSCFTKGLLIAENAA